MNETLRELKAVRSMQKQGLYTSFKTEVPQTAGTNEASVGATSFSTAPFTNASVKLDKTKEN